MRVTYLRFLHACRAIEYLASFQSLTLITRSEEREIEWRGMIRET